MFIFKLVSKFDLGEPIVLSQNEYLEENNTIESVEFVELFPYMPVGEITTYVLIDLLSVSEEILLWQLISEKHTASNKDYVENF